MSSVTSRWGGFAGRALVLVALATVPWLVWLAWPAPPSGPSGAAPEPLAQALTRRLEALEGILDTWRSDAVAVATDPVVVAATAVGDESGLADVLAGHPIVAGYANALAIDPDLRVRAFARPTRWAGLRISATEDPLGRVVEASRLGDGPMVSPILAVGSASEILVAAPLRDGDRRLGTLVLVPTPRALSEWITAAPDAAGTRFELRVAIDGQWHRLETRDRGELRLARLPADPELDRVLTRVATGAPASTSATLADGTSVELAAQTFAPLSAIALAMRSPGAPPAAGRAAPSAIWPLAIAIGLALALAGVTGRGRPPADSTTAPARRREPRFAARAAAQRDAGGLEDPRRTLVATLGPELRAPLAAIIGTAVLATPEVREPRLAARIARIRESAEQLLGYLDDLALHAGLDTGDGAPEDAFRLRDVLAVVAERTASDAAARGHDLVFRRGPDVPEHLAGPAQWFSETLVRLIREVGADAPPGRPIRVGVERVAPTAAAPSDRTILTVSVQAGEWPLIDAPATDEAETVAFDAASLPTASTIDLAIAARLVERLGGVLRRLGPDGQGFLFDVALRERQDDRPPRPSLRGRRALVVDELGVTADAIAEMLARAGLDVHEVPSLAAAAAEVRRAMQPRARAYDLVLVDDRATDAARLGTLAPEGIGPGSWPPVLWLATPGSRAVPPQAARFVLPRPVDEPVLLEAIVSMLGLGPPLPTLGPAPAEPVVDDTAPLAHRRLLLVDDNPINRAVGVELLQRAGASVATAEDGRAAVEMLATGRAFDAVLMDLEMPRLDGLAATRAIRSDPARATLPIIAWTEHALPEDRARCLAAGMNDWLPKPVAPARLYATVARWTEGARRPGSTDVVDSSPAEATSRPPLDADMAIGLLGGDEPLYRRLLAAFVDEHAGDARRIREAIAAGRHGEAREAAHGLKGLAATLGLAPLSRIASAIELNLRAGSAVPDSLLEALDERLAEALSAAATWLTIRRPPAPEPSPASAPEEVAADWSLLDEQIARGELAALGTFERLAARRRDALDEAEWEAIRDARAQLDFERAASLRRRLD
jgi:CheY-like chemotaxis protein